MFYEILIFHFNHVLFFFLLFFPEKRSVPDGASVEVDLGNLGMKYGFLCS